jgi:HEAT repeat protein
LKLSAFPKPQGLNKLLLFALLQLAVIFGLIWVIAGNDRLFRNTVPIEQRLVSHNESIREKAQQELLGLELDSKKKVVSRLIPALEQEDAFVRKWAAISLALIGPSAQEAIPALLQTVSAREKGVAQASRVALSEIGAPEAQQLPSLLRTLQDPRDSVRCEAALSIGKMGPAGADAVPILISFMERQNEAPACFEEALASLAVGVPAVYPRVLELLASGHVELRRKAANVLALAGAKNPETINALLSALSGEPDAQTRAHLTKALQLPYVPEEDRTDVLAAALHDDYVPVRLEAARAIRGSAPQGKKSLRLILRMLRDTEPLIRRLGLETLRRSGLKSPELLQKVAKAQRDPDPGVRCRAAESLIEYGSPDRVSISLLIGDLSRDEDTARCAVDVLGLAGLFENDVMRSMIHLVEEEKDPDIRSRAAHVLMHLGPRAREAVPALLHAQKDQIAGAEMALKAVRASNGTKRR